MLLNKNIIKALSLLALLTTSFDVYCTQVPQTEDEEDEVESAEYKTEHEDSTSKKKRPQEESQDSKKKRWAKLALAGAGLATLGTIAIGGTYLAMTRGFGGSHDLFSLPPKFDGLFVKVAEDYANYFQLSQQNTINLWLLPLHNTQDDAIAEETYPSSYLYIIDINVPTGQNTAQSHRSIFQLQLYDTTQFYSGTKEYYYKNNLGSASVFNPSQPNKIPTFRLHEDVYTLNIDTVMASIDIANAKQTCTNKLATTSAQTWISVIDDLVAYITSHKANPEKATDCKMAVFALSKFIELNLHSLEMD